MTDARRIDLNYGHFGEPVYDVHHQEWHFPRKVQDGILAPSDQDSNFGTDIFLAAPRLQILGEPRVLLPPQSPISTAETCQTSPQPNRQVEQLLRAHPEFAPSSALLPPLAEASEAIEELTGGYDPAVADRLAFGRALRPARSQKSAQSVPVVAVIGGVAGELVRIFQLTPEVCRWDGEPNIRVNNEVFQSRVQGIWSPGGSAVQQIRFAEAKGEPTEWLAVRYSGATSILRVILREDEVPTLHKIACVPAFGANVEVRFELLHVVTLPVQRTGGASHTDVCFNPRNPTEFAVIDTCSRWSTWKFKSVFEKTSVWMLEDCSFGVLAEGFSDEVEDVIESEARYDGWGAIAWIINGAGLLVCSRRKIAGIELQVPPRQVLLPDLALSKTTDWILDLKQSTADSGYVFIATSSRIFWIHLAEEQTEGSERPQMVAKIVLAWMHFRNEIDLSLLMQIVHLGSSMFLPAMPIMLYLLNSP